LPVYGSYIWLVAIVDHVEFTVEHDCSVPFL